MGCDWQTGVGLESRAGNSCQTPDWSPEQATDSGLLTEENPKIHHNVFEFDDWGVQCEETR